MIEALIKDSLIRLSAATQSRGNYENAGHGQCENTNAQAAIIARELDVLDALLAKERRNLHPQLTHFLANRSYAKALAFLGGETEGIPAAARGKLTPQTHE